jgi:mono/diheme cytochrome c family protein
MRHILGTVALSAGLLMAQAPSDPIANPTAEDLARGKRLFEGQCAVCHGIIGTGGRGANLAQPRLRHASSDQALFLVIKDGIDGTEMREAWQMTDREILGAHGGLRPERRYRARPIHLYEPGLRGLSRSSR